MKKIQNSIFISLILAVLEKHFSANKYNKILQKVIEIPQLSHALSVFDRTVEPRNSLLLIPNISKYGFSRATLQQFGQILSSYSSDFKDFKKFGHFAFLENPYYLDFILPKPNSYFLTHLGQFQQLADLIDEESQIRIEKLNYQQVGFKIEYYRTTAADLVWINCFNNFLQGILEAMISLWGARASSVLLDKLKSSKKSNELEEVYESFRLEATLAWSEEPQRIALKRQHELALKAIAGKEEYYYRILNFQQQQEVQRLAQLNEEMEISQRLQALDFEEINSVMASKIMPLINVEFYTLFVLDEKGNFLLKGTNRTDKLQNFIPPGNSPIMEEVVKVGEPIIRDFKNDLKAASNRPVYEGSLTSIHLPLKVGGKVYGIVNLTPTNRELSEVEFMNAKRFLGYLSVAIYNVLQHQHIKLANQKLEFANQQLADLARRDALTGLFNHGHFQKMLAREMARVDRYRHGLALILIDLDRFKDINDTYGHQAGDQVLQIISSLIYQSIRSVDIPARYGGDEFALILPEIPLSGVRTLAERLRLKVQHHTFKIKDNSEKSTEYDLKITISCGIGRYRPFDNFSKADFIRQVDAALYEAKRAGRNRVVVYQEEKNPDSRSVTI